MTLAALDLEIASMQRALTALKAERKRMASREQMQRQNADPAFRAKASAATRKYRREYTARHGLPKMTPSQRYKYRLVREVAGRDKALQTVFG